MVDAPVPPPPAVGYVALTSVDAVRVAVHDANMIAPGHEFVELPKRSAEHWFGWVVIVVPQKYLQTGDERELVPGVSAFVVEDHPRKITPLPSSVPFDRALAEYERRKKEAAPFR